MKINDYNGTGDWSLERVCERYAAHCEQLRMQPVEPLVPREHRSKSTVWIYPVMNEVIDRIRSNDLASIAIGVELVEEEDQMNFGKLLKSDAARRLRQHVETLSDAQKERIRRRVVFMLLHGPFPHEMTEYVKLLKAIGLGTYRDQIRSSPMQDDIRAKRFYHSLASEPLKSGW